MRRLGLTSFIARPHSTRRARLSTRLFVPRPNIQIPLIYTVKHISSSSPSPSPSPSPSSSANPYPYPTHPNPTPHQIFHLPINASRKDVKARYYDLVRIYHPDSPINRSLPPPLVQSRFQAISKAYDVLRGKSRVLPSGETEPLQKKHDHHNLGTAMWKAKQRKKADLTYGSSVFSDKLKDRLLMGAVLFAVGGFVIQTWVTRQQATTAPSLRDYLQARSDHHGSLTRQAIAGATTTRVLSKHPDDDALDADCATDKPP